MSTKCKYYGSKQGCKRGNSCRFKHDQSSITPLCRYTNNCRYGKKCKFRHDIDHSKENSRKPKSTQKSIIKRPDILFYGYIRMSKLQKLIPIEIIKYLISHYRHIFESEILSVSEQNEYQKLLKINNKFINKGNIIWNLIYRGSRDGMSEFMFKNKCHNAKTIMCLIRTCDNDVFGGYTSKGWKGKFSIKNVYDNEAFIFLIKSHNNDCKACIVNVKPNHFALRIEPDSYLIFGGENIAFGIKEYNYLPQNGTARGYMCDGKTTDYEQFPQICNKFDVSDIEVFEMQQIYYCNF
eukprot:244837_1